MKFEWDPKKAASNLSKHRVAFEEGLTVFADPLAKIFDDEDHSTEGQREIIIGHSPLGEQPTPTGLLRGTTGVDSDLQRTEGNEGRAGRL